MVVCLVIAGGFATIRAASPSSLAILAHLSENVLQAVPLGEKALHVIFAALGHLRFNHVPDKSLFLLILWRGEVAAKVGDSQPQEIGGQGVAFVVGYDLVEIPL